jgi:hypothetical protein
MMQRFAFLVLTASLAAAVAGCSGSTSAPDPTASTETHSHDHEGHAEVKPLDAPAPEPSPDSPLAGYLLNAEPEAGAPINVLDARKDTKDGDDVVLVGRVGGSVSPIVEGRAMFTIADKSFKPCNETGDDGCPTPWDYCCEAGVNKGLATIKFVGEDGKTIAADAREGFGLKELQTVVVKGKAKRDEAGNLTILATGVYVKR